MGCQEVSLNEENLGEKAEEIAQEKDWKSVAKASERQMLSSDPEHKMFKHIRNVQTLCFAFLLHFHCFNELLRLFTIFLATFTKWGAAQDFCTVVYIKNTYNTFLIV